MPEIASAPGGTAGTPGNLVAKPGVALGGMVAIASAAQFISALDSSAMPAVTREICTRR